MNSDLFISYAWTSPLHREWVRLFASHIHLIGYDIKIDEAVDYGASLSGFMQKVTDASHVLLLVDENYVHRADNLPKSGVGIETKWISDVFKNKPVTWLSVVYIRNPELKLPVWLAKHNPKGFNFNSQSEKNQFPGAFQINDIWRWLEGLPADTKNAVPIAVLRTRAARIERIDRLRDPANYASPAIKGNVTFRHDDHQYFSVGYGEYEFKIQFSSRSQNSVYVLKDHINAVGLITTPTYDPATVENFLRPGRSAEPNVGQSVVLMNSHGTLCIITIVEVQREVNDIDYIHPHVLFSYGILTN